MTRPLLGRWSKKIPLQVVLLLPLLGLILLAMTLVGYLSYYNGQQAVNHVAHQLRCEINDRIGEHISLFLDTSVKINEANANALRRGRLDSTDQMALERYFWDQIQLFHTVTSINFGNIEGGLANAGREGLGGYLYVIRTEGFVQGPFYKYKTDSYGQRQELVDTIPDFDARERSWYTDAVTKGADVWSDIYTLFTGQDLCLTLSRPVFNEEDELLGVTAVNIFLSHLGDFMAGLDIGTSGQSFIIEPSGLLIASSTSEAPYTPEEGRRYARESTDPLTVRAVETLQDKFSDYKNISYNQQFDFRHNGERQFGLVAPFEDPHGLDWLIVTVIPERDFMGQIYANQRTTILLMVITLVIVAGVSLFITRRIIRPILQLKRAASALSRGEWDQANHHHSSIEEIHELSHSFKHMVDQLQQMVVGLNQEIAERRRVEERLKESEERFRAISDLALDAIILIDDKGSVVYWSPSAEKIFGHRSRDVLGEDVHEILMPEKYRESYTKGFKHFKSKGEGPVINRIVELTGKHRLGHEIPIEIAVSPIRIKGEYWASAIIRDISDRKKMEARIEYQYQFQKMVASISATFINIAEEWMDEAITHALYQLGHFFHVDRTYLFQLSSDGLTMSNTQEWCAEGIDPQIHMLQSFSLSEMSWMMEEIFAQKTVIITDVDSLPYEEEREEFKRQEIKSLLVIPLIKDKSVFGFLGLDSVKKKRIWTKEEIDQFKLVSEILANVLIKQKIEKELRENEARYRTLVSNIPGVIFRCERDEYWTMRFISDDIKDLTGFPPEDFMDNRVRSFSSIIVPEDREMVHETIQESISFKRPFILQYRIINASGYTLWVQENGQGVFNQKGQLLYIDGVIIDVTERKKVEERLALQTQELEQEMDKARRVHQQMLPESLPVITGLSMAAHYQPAKKLGGDFYDTILVDNRLVFYLSDVSGHGLDGSMLSLFVKHTIKSYLSFSTSSITPEAILKYLAEQFNQEEYLGEYFISIFLSVLNLETMELHYSGLGFQDRPLVQMGDGERIHLISKGMFISPTVPLKLLNFEEGHITLTEGTTLFINTDGLTEQEVRGHYYMDRLPQVFYAHSHLPPYLISQIVVEDFQDFNEGSIQGYDDITFFVLQIEPQGIEKYSLEIASSFEEMERVNDYVKERLKDYERVHTIVTCVTELVANAIEHGNRLKIEKRVSVQLQILDSYILIQVCDEGDGFDWKERFQRSFELEGHRERGRGLALIRLLCEGLFYNHKGDQATMIFTI